MAQPTNAFPQLPGFAFATTVDELAAAEAMFPENERAALRAECPLVMINQETGAVAILRPADDGSWITEIMHAVGEVL